jgi:hypothetical protein
VLDLVFPRDATHEGPDSFFEIRGNPTFAIFRAENEIQMEGAIGVCHGL